MSLVFKAVPALLVSALLFSPAAAAPVGPNTMEVPAESMLVQVRGHGGHGGHGGKGHGGRHGGGHHGKGHKHHGGHHHGHPGRHHHGGHWHHGGRWHHGGHWHGGGRWVAGRSYHVAPPGWRHYGARPWNWQALGCVVVNGFWFCP